MYDPVLSIDLLYSTFLEKGISKILSFINALSQNPSKPRKPSWRLIGKIKDLNDNDPFKLRFALKNHDLSKIGYLALSKGRDVINVQCVPFLKNMEIPQFLQTIYLIKFADLVHKSVTSNPPKMALNFGHHYIYFQNMPTGIPSLMTYFSADCFYTSSHLLREIDAILTTPPAFRHNLEPFEKFHHSYSLGQGTISYFGHDLANVATFYIRKGSENISLHCNPIYQDGKCDKFKIYILLFYFARFLSSHFSHRIYSHYITVL